MKRLRFDIRIDAPRSQVWDTMLEAETYNIWVAPFAEGAYYDGSWEEGATIRFLVPSGDGMRAEIAENRAGEFVSIRHLGEINGGVEDLTSESVQAWAPAYENYSFADRGDATEVVVEIDTLPKYEKYMLETYPKALKVLKQLCEEKSTRDGLR